MDSPAERFAALLAVQPCDHFTSRVYRMPCIRNGRHPFARYGEDAACVSCSARWTLLQTEDADPPAGWTLLPPDGPPSLMTQALTACNVDCGGLTDRELATLLLRAITRGDNDLRAPRWAHLDGAVHHGSTVRAALLRVAGIDPNEETGWPHDGPCPMCGESDGDEVLRG